MKCLKDAECIKSNAEALAKCAMKKAAKKGVAAADAAKFKDLLRKSFTRAIKKAEGKPAPETKRTGPKVNKELFNGLLEDCAAPIFKTKEAAGKCLHDAKCIKSKARALGKCIMEDAKKLGVAAGDMAKLEDIMKDELQKAINSAEAAAKEREAEKKRKAKEEADRKKAEAKKRAEEKAREAAREKKRQAAKRKREAARKKRLEAK